MCLPAARRGVRIFVLPPAIRKRFTTTVVFCLLRTAYANRDFFFFHDAEVGFITKFEVYFFPM